MIWPRSIQQLCDLRSADKSQGLRKGESTLRTVAVLVVDLIAWPVGKAIDRASFLNLTKDDDE